VRADYVSREEWGATKPTKKWTYLNPKRVQGIVVHHSGVTGGPTGATAVRAFERHHMTTRGWSSIAYNWLVDVDGHEPLSLEAQQGFRTVIDELQHTYSGGLWIKGHRDLASTSCPGNWLYDWVGTGTLLVAPPGAHVPTVDWGGLIAYMQALGAEVQARPLRRRMRGVKVRLVQATLPRWGCDPGAADGIFGWRTKAAVRRFQRESGFLKVNGVVNRATWDALFFR
jgi:hypothetical protein